MIEYVNGDATAPTARPAVIVHICNDIGAWGKGFVMALSARWRSPEAAYRAWVKEAGSPLPLGDVQFVDVEPGLTVVNLIGQVGIRSRAGVVPVRYPAIETGLQRVAQHAVARGASVHMPRIGCGLAGGTWAEVEPLLISTLVTAQVPTVVYDF